LQGRLPSSSSFCGGGQYKGRYDGQPPPCVRIPLEPPGQETDCRKGDRIEGVPSPSKGLSKKDRLDHDGCPERTGSTSRNKGVCPEKNACGEHSPPGGKNTPEKGKGDQFPGNKCGDPHVKSRYGKEVRRSPYSMPFCEFRIADSQDSREHISPDPGREGEKDPSPDSCSEGCQCTYRHPPDEDIRCLNFRVNTPRPPIDPLVKRGTGEIRKGDCPSREVHNVSFPGGTVWPHPDEIPPVPAINHERAPVPPWPLQDHFSTIADRRTASRGKRIHSKACGQRNEESQQGESRHEREETGGTI